MVAQRSSTEYMIAQRRHNFHPLWGGNGAYIAYPLGLGLHRSVPRFRAVRLPRWFGTDLVAGLGSSSGIDGRGGGGEATTEDTEGAEFPQPFSVSSAPLW